MEMWEQEGSRVQIKRGPVIASSSHTPPCQTQPLGKKETLKKKLPQLQAQFRLHLSAVIVLESVKFPRKSSFSHGWLGGFPSWRKERGAES